MEDVVAEKRREDDTMLDSSHSEKILKVENEEEFYTYTGRPIHTFKRPTWKTSGDYILPSAHTSIPDGGDPPS